MTTNVIRKSFISSIPTQDISTDARKLKNIGLRVIEPLIRSTAINNLHLCPRYFLFADRLGLKLRRYDGARNIGILYHQAIGALYNGLFIGNLPLHLECELQEQKLILSKQANKAGFLPGGALLEKVIDQAKKDHSIALALAHWTWKHYPLDFKEWEVIAVEKLYDVDIKDPAVRQPVRIRVDSLLRNRETGELWFEDRKTTSKDPLQLSDTLLFAVQPKLYRLALTLAFPNDKIAGVIHKIVHVPGIRQRLTKKPESWQQFLDRLIETCEERQHQWKTYNTLGRGGRPKEKIPYHESHIRFTGPVLDEELAIQIREMSQAARCKIHLGRFYKVAGSCFKFERACSFLRLCTVQEPGAWKSIIEEHYEISHRDEDDLKEPPND